MDGGGEVLISQWLVVVVFFYFLVPADKGIGKRKKLFRPLCVGTDTIAANNFKGKMQEKVIFAEV